LERSAQFAFVAPLSTRSIFKDGIYLGINAYILSMFIQHIAHIPMFLQ
jgi:hypothetical protein